MRTVRSLLQQMLWEKCIHYRSSPLFFVCVLMYNSQRVEYCFKGFTAVLFRQHRAPGVWYNRGSANIWTPAAQTSFTLKLICYTWRSETGVFVSEFLTFSFCMALLQLVSLNWLQKCIEGINGSSPPKHWLPFSCKIEDQQVITAISINKQC